MYTTTFVWMVAIPLFASLVIYLIGRLGVQQGFLPQRSKVVHWSALIAAGIAWVPFFLATRDFLAQRNGLFQIEAIWLEVDGLSLLMTFIVLLLGTLVILFSRSYMSGEIGEEKYYVMLLVMMSVMIGLSHARDLFNLWIWFEAMAVSSYMLVAFYRRQPASLEAGMKYLVQSAVGSVLILLGIAAVFSQSHTLTLHLITNNIPQSPIFLAAGGLFVIGFGVKIAMVPMHTWLPDAHTHAPSGISAMLSGVVIEIGLLALLRVLSVLVPTSDAWGSLLMGFGIINILYGNLMALQQKQVKRLLAYSSISHIGYILLGLGIAFHSQQIEAAQGAFLHIFTHGTMKGLAFLSSGALLYSMKLSSGNHDALVIDDLAGAARRFPLPALALSVAVLGLGGLPPLAGFMSKWQIFAAGFATRDLFVICSVVFAAIISVLSLAYYAPIVNMLFRREVNEKVEAGIKIPQTMLISLFVLMGFVIVVGIWPGLMDWIIQPASLALFVGM